MKKYKNIVFDIGQVLMGYRWMDMLVDDYGMSNEKAKEFGETIFSDKLWLEFDRGVRDYWDIAAEYENRYPQLKEVLHWFFSNAKLMRVTRPDVWEKVGKLKEKGYKIYLLSNYSKKLLDDHAGDASFWDYVDGAIVSYMVHELKPDAPIYKALFDKYNLEPSECLFLDDREANVEGSKKVGMDSIIIESKEQLLGLLDDLLSVM